MGWVRVSDDFYDNDKLIDVGPLGVAMHFAAIAFCNRSLTDGLIKRVKTRMLMDFDGIEVADAENVGTSVVESLVRAGLWHESGHDCTKCHARADGGEPGSREYLIHDYFEYQPTKAAVEVKVASNRRRVELFRNTELRQAIRDRDGDECRYCGKTVEWNNRRGPLGGTYDHIDPEGDNSIGNLVVCCRGCNSSKGHRTPDQAGMALLPPVGVESASGSDLNRNLTRNNGVRTPPNPNPNPSTSLVETLEGGVTEVDAREPKTPRPQCPRHAENHEGPCGACERRRKWDEANAAAVQADELESQRRKRELATNCPICHGTNWIPNTEPAVKCKHQEASNA